MGKNTDKLFITHSEWSRKSQTATPSQSAPPSSSILPFWTCSISQQPVNQGCAVCDNEGHVFDIKNILPYILRNKINPVTNKPLTSAGELTKLKLVQNGEGEYVDPLTYKPFTAKSVVMVVKTTGNVYFSDTLKNQSVDPVTEQPFEKEDVIRLTGGVGVLVKKAEKQPAQAVTLKRKATEEPQFTSSTSAHETSKNDGSALTSKLIPNRFMSPGYANIETSLGSISIELYPRYSPKAVYNFISNARSGYYDGTVFHRNVRNFLIQGGDPARSPNKTASGNVPKPRLDDEILTNETNAPYKLDSRGIIAMQNMGTKNSNDVHNPNNPSNTQLFITYRRIPHLDGKYTVFGKVLQGLDVLDKMERADVDKENRPKTDIVIESVTILEDPFEAGDKKNENENENQAEVDDTPWLKKKKVESVKVGKYIAENSAKTSQNTALLDTNKLALPATSNDDSNWKQKRKQKTSLKNSSFAGW